MEKITRERLAYKIEKVTKTVRKRCKEENLPISNSFSGNRYSRKPSIISICTIVREVCEENNIKQGIILSILGL